MKTSQYFYVNCSTTKVFWFSVWLLKGLPFPPSPPAQSPKAVRWVSALRSHGSREPDWDWEGVQLGGLLEEVRRWGCALGSTHNWENIQNEKVCIPLFFPWNFSNSTGKNLCLFLTAHKYWIDLTYDHSSRFSFAEVVILAKFLKILLLTWMSKLK